MSEGGSTDAIVARLVGDGRWRRVAFDGPTIASVEEIDDSTAVSEGDDWIAPAFWDIQTNGRLGVSFSDPTLTAEQVREIVLAQDEIGSARICPTLITAPADDMRHGVATIAAACEADPGVAHRVVGIHLEGPFLSPDDGYRGAHPIEAIRDPDWDLFRSLQDASGGRVVLLTLAPERPGAIELIEKVSHSGVVVAIGHSAADPETIRRAVDAGARLSTHLGNGIVASLPRHPNPIWTQAACDGLTASLIADGHHLDDDVLRVLVRAKTPDRVVLVSDASPLAGLPPGAYGRWAVEPSGRVVVAGTPYLAGANRALTEGVDRLIRAVGLPPAEAIACASIHPARLLGKPGPTIAPGRPADLIRFRLGAGGRFELVETLVFGRRTPASPESLVSRPPAA
ncbi:N-acetylglucosamine-6-phosphate deacetylase [Tautonia plasticadhaerens]|uniref:N-acetylglucosamine-6-phosphate deacetylase n=1 Tax=Tautonia plasticadhaerens TaxID=2527974 RepID=A0A518GV13_9BACT|nr:amidohydrolase family protein [Tautonia plasticadhaerens]QDV32422.1 N-acetylglucosamine-6-phosphate deacetylase [Tautonia plasticadhaerens]